MSREIKFRTWLPFEKRMAYEIEKSRFLNETIANTKHENISCVLMQYTGLHDANGKEIYEGDILFEMSDSDNRFVVKWDDNEALFYIEKPDSEFYTFGDVNSDWYEVHGNIYQNPELMR